MSHPSPDDRMEECTIPPCDKFNEDSIVTSQLEHCEENPHEKTEDAPHEQSTPATYKDMSHPSPEECTIPPCDKIHDDSRVTSQLKTCEENPHETTPCEENNTATCKTSLHENVLHQACDSALGTSKADPDFNTSSQLSPSQNDKTYCDNGSESVTEMATDEHQRAPRQDMSHPYPDNQMEECTIPACDKFNEDSIVTSQLENCEENQHEKTEDAPHEQSTPATYKDMSHPSPDNQMEECTIPPCDKISDDSRVTTQHKACEENRHEKTEDTPCEQNITATCKVSLHEVVLHTECDSSPEKSKAEQDFYTSSQITPLHNEKVYGDNGNKSDSEMASAEHQMAPRQDMSHPYPDNQMEECTIPACDKFNEDSIVTSQLENCEENQHEKTEDAPHEQSTPATYKVSPHDGVLQQECDSSSEKSNVEPDFYSSSQIAPLQNDKSHCDNDGACDVEMASDDEYADCPPDIIADGEVTSYERTLNLQNADKDFSEHKETDTTPRSRTSTDSVSPKESFAATQKLQMESQAGEGILFKELLEEMKIDTKQTTMLTLQDVLEIGPESLMTDDFTDDNGLWYFIRRLMSLNGDARNINKLFKKSGKSDNISTDDSFMFLTERDLFSYIHPLDVVSAAFHYSDHFLQQEIVSKMLMCQFAVPLLLPAVDSPECTLMLWAMRGIVKKWRPQSLTDSKGFIEESLVNVSMPTISLVRLGKCRLSKSKILNQLLGSMQHQHEHFVHRDMEGGKAKKKISEGLVEICWYFPGGKGKFPEPVAFTNLRGKLESNLKQFNFLTEISSVMVILTEGISEDQYELLMKNNSDNTKYLFIISPEDNRTMEDTEKRLKLLAPVMKLTQDNVLLIPSSTNETTAGSELYSSLQSLVQSNLNTISLETMAEQASRHGIQIDEDFEECQAAKLKAKEITDDIEDVVKYKKETMKLQAEPLRKMAKLEKEMCQMKGQGNSNGEKYKSNLRKQCQLIRKQQWKYNIPSGISKFVKAIASTANRSEKLFFLQWLRFHLNSVARKSLHPLQAQYKEKCNLPGNQKELAVLDQRISDSSLGIEHFLREVGQFYEAWHFMGKSKKSKDINLEHLPKIAADLLLDGFPLELIDGDASRIPLQWIKDVLTELDKKIKGKNRLRVITVLGVQSTGKSTLLNTMFGLQFPVASGRCTRGAFMTLLKVKENLQEVLRCQFILVIDTEGLKAPELDSFDGSYEHDNELATLVIGLSDITLINMAMENTTEMKDILQIVIHAFLRMKEIGEKPNCQFVHQNASDVSAPVMNMRGRKKLMDQLDEMTRTVAAMENKTQFKHFSDVMEYDLEHNNCYIAGLWHGAPPMASVSNAYSENVNELKQILLKFMKDRHNKTQNINEFISWVSDLWSAVKHENFIFSFRNSLIAKAYNQLSKKYSEREWKFCKLMHEWFTKSETLIKNQSAETLEAKANGCYKEAEITLTREEKKILSWINEYFTKETDCAQIIKYKADFEISARNLRKNLESSSFNKLREAIQIQKEQIRIQQLYSQNIERMKQKVSNFIEDCRKKKHELSDAKLEEELESIWKDAVKDLEVTHRPKRDIEGSMLLVLTKDMNEKGSGVNEKLQQTKYFPKPKGQQNTSIIVQIKPSIKNKAIQRLKKNFQHDGFFQRVLCKCIKYSTEQTHKDVDYDDTYCRGVLNIFDESCKHGDANNYFSADRELDLKLEILGHVLGDFEKMHLNFFKNNDPHAKLESLKPLYFDTFKNFFQKKNESKSLAERVCKNFFKPSITDHINRKLGIEMVDDITSSKGSEKYTSRMFFQFTVLENLLEENNFEKYVEYSSDYETFVKSWITNYFVKEYKNIGTLQDKILTDIMERVRSSLQNPRTLNLHHVSDFLAHLCEKLNSDLVLSQQTMKAIIFENSATIEDFIEYMRNSLTDIEKEIREEITSLSTEDVLSRLKVKPQDELFKKVFGCGKQCPFCKVPCEAGGTDHKEHFASVHRPQGLGTYRWVTTEVLCHDICSTLVVGNKCFKNKLTEWKYHPYKDYRDHYPDWRIQPDESIEASDYWKFVLKEYNEEFAAEYNAKPANYPEEWNSLTREMAKKSLQHTFNM